MIDPADKFPVVWMFYNVVVRFQRTSTMFRQMHSRLQNAPLAQCQFCVLFGGYERVYFIRKTQLYIREKMQTEQYSTQDAISINSEVKSQTKGKGVVIDNHHHYDLCDDMCV